LALTIITINMPIRSNDENKKFTNSSVTASATSLDDISATEKAH